MAVFAEVVAFMLVDFLRNKVVPETTKYCYGVVGALYIYISRLGWLGHQHPWANDTAHT